MSPLSSSSSFMWQTTLSFVQLATNSFFGEMAHNPAKDERERDIHRAEGAQDLTKNLTENPDTVDDGDLSLTKRRADVMVPDLSIFSPPMAYLSQALDGLDPNPDAGILDAVAKLLQALAATYRNEKARYDTIVPALEEVFHVKFAPPFDVSFEPEEPEERPSAFSFGRKRRITHPGAHVDGAVVTPVQQGIDHACPVILQLEELEMARAGDLRVTATYTKFIAHPKSAFIREETSCPAILIGISGTHICLAYAVLVDAFLAQGIDQQWFLLGGATSEQQYANIRNFARVVPAVRDAIKDLQRFYTQLRPAPTGTRPPPYLPNPTPADPSSSRIGDLKFSDKLSRDPSQALFRATFDNKDVIKDVIVKFCDGYGTVAHDRLARRGLAPPLFHTEPLVGGLTMVVMAFDAGMMSAYDKYFGRGLPESVMTEVDRALAILHAKEQDQGQGAPTATGTELGADPHPSEPLVHGDLCRENILVPRDAERHTPVWLVGFRWAGVAGRARYPVSVGFAEQRGVCIGRIANGVITEEHDTQMRDYLVTQYV